MEDEEKDKKETYPPIIDQLREYAETRIKLTKYKAIEKGSSMMAGLVVGLIMAICFLLTFLFASFTLALFLGSVFHSYWEGFGTVALLYLFIAIMALVLKKSFEKPMINAMIKMLFNDGK